METVTIAEAVRSAREAANTPDPQAKAATFKAVKAVNVDERGVIYGIGASIGTDRENEAVEKGALIGLAYDFCAAAERTFLANHDKGAPIEAQLVESWLGEPVLKSGKVLAPGELAPADDPIDLAQCRKGAETHWFVGVRPTDPEVVKAARAGDVAGFSWGGYAQKESA